MISPTTTSAIITLSLGLLACSSFGLTVFLDEDISITPKNQNTYDINITIGPVWDFEGEVMPDVSALGIEVPRTRKNETLNDIHLELTTGKSRSSIPIKTSNGAKQEGTSFMLAKELLKSAELVIIYRVTGEDYSRIYTAKLSAYLKKHAAEKK